MRGLFICGTIRFSSSSSELNGSKCVCASLLSLGLTGFVTSICYLYYAISLAFSQLYLHRIHANAKQLNDRPIVRPQPSPLIPIPENISGLGLSILGDSLYWTWLPTQYAKIIYKGITSTK